MNPPVEKAIAETRAAFVGHQVDVEPDSEGGAYVTVQGLHLGDQYAPNTSWVAFHITFQYPHADVYPHFCVAGLKKNGQDVTPPFHKGDWKTPSIAAPATSFSRRSNRWNPAADTAAIKLTKVLDWIRSQ
jgi:hypothetical protein